MHPALYLFFFLLLSSTFKFSIHYPVTEVLHCWAVFSTHTRCTQKAQQIFQQWVTLPWSTSLIKWYAVNWDVSELCSLTSRRGQGHYIWQTAVKRKSVEALKWTEAYYWAITTMNGFKTRINAAYWNVKGANHKWMVVFSGTYCVIY